MPKNREPVKPESSEEEEEEEEEEEHESGDGSSSSSSEEEEETAIPETQKPPPSVTSEDDSETESGNESDESDSEPDLNHKNPTFVPPTNPIAATPISQKPTAKKPTPPKPSEPVTPAKRTAQVKEDVSKKQQSKKKKSNQEAAAPPVPKNSDSVIISLASADNAKKFFQRLWSDDDEVAILQGMIDYEAEKNADPRADCDAFLEFIKDNLQVDVNKVQLQHKIRRLKKKYDNIKSKDKIHLVKKPHDQAVYDLSDKIWGHETAPAADKSHATANKKRTLFKDGEGAMSVDVEQRLGSGWVYGLSMEDRILHLGDELFGGGNSSVDGAREWKRLRKEEMEISLKKLDLKRAQIKLVLDNFD